MILVNLTQLVETLHYIRRSWGSKSKLSFIIDKM